MLILLSPAKRLKEENPKQLIADRTPVFQEQAATVNNELRKLSPHKLMTLQSISKDLAQLNAQRNQEWGTRQPNENSYYTAVKLFNGDAYLGLDASTLDDDTLKYAQGHLRILSGLYGILRPLDRIEPYRLEMGTQLKIGKKENLYAFWSAYITPHIGAEFNGVPIVNLASNEYSKAVNKKELNNDFIDVVFKDRNKSGQYRVMSFYAKKARGLMTRYILENKIENPKELIQFDVDGYYFAANDSSPTNLVFLRDH